MKIISMKCPECKALVKVSADKKYSYCPYCGAMFLIDDETKRVEINKNIKIDKNIHSKNENYDYARIKEAEVDARKSISDNKTMVVIFVSFCILLLGVYVVLGVSDWSEKKQDQALISSAAGANIALVSSLYSSGEYTDENYMRVKEDLEKRGFTNVITVVEKSSGKPDTVVNVKVDGEFLKKDKKYPSDVEVVVRYRGEKLFE